MPHEKSLVLFFATVSVFLLFPELVFSKGPSLSVRVDKEAITLGDEITYEISTTHHEDILMDWPDEETRFSPFELKRYRPLPRQEVGNQVTEGVRYTLTIFKLGVWKIPSLTIFYTDYRKPSLPESPRKTHSVREEGSRRSLVTEPIEIRVRSVVGEEVTPVLDIQRLKSPEENILLGWIKKIGTILLAIGAVCLFGYGVIRLLPKPVPRVVREDPVKISLRDLGEFKKSFQGKKVTKAHYEHLSKILRRYLAKQFDPLTLDLTTKELYQQMSQYRPCQSLADKVSEVLTACDLVKFADRDASEGELDLFIKEVEEAIRHGTSF